MRQRIMLIALLTALLCEPATAAADPSDLVAFRSCGELLSYGRANAHRTVHQYPASWTGNVDGSLWRRAAEPDPATVDDSSTLDDAYGADQDVAVSSDDAAATPDASTTNVQEQGIDEPDVVKNDGRRLYVVAGSQLLILDGTSDHPAILGRLDLAIADGTMLREGNRLLVMGGKPAPRTKAQKAAGTARYEAYPRVARILELDIAEVSHPRLVRTLDAPGRAVSARQVGSTVRLVIGNDLTDDYDFSEAVHRHHTLGLRTFVPRTTLRSAATGARYSRPLAECTDVRRPVAYAGVDLLTVLTIDMRAGLVGLDRDAVMASPQTVYASAGTLYVASAKEADWEAHHVLRADTFTDVHAFDTSIPGRTTYAGSGRVYGLPVNQYSFSEWNGDLRVATTMWPGWLGSHPIGRVDNRVTVLRRAGSRLSQIGLIRGLGKGETIYGVRFAGAQGYLVTFLNEDPLHVLDLADPRNPRQLGVLKIPGYSAYLHPLGDGLLLGVGQDETRGGSFRGTQVSLFDVSDPAHPRRLAARNLGEGEANSDYDPHAFLWWPKRKLALISHWGVSPGRETWDDKSHKIWGGALVGLTVGRGAHNLVEAGRIMHGPGWDHPDVVRAVVIGERLFSVSELGVGASRVSDLRSLGFTAYEPVGASQAP
jgi:hypothetical protein